MSEKKLPQTEVKSNLFKKAVEAIHCSSTLSFIALKMLNVMGKNAMATIHNDEVFRISVSSAADAIKFNSNNTIRIKNAVTELKENSIKWDEGGEFGITSFLAEARIKGGVIEYSFPPSVRKLFALENGGVWGLLDLDLIGEMKSAYTLKLYENCIRYVGIGMTGHKPVHWWREKLQATKPAYSDFRNFKRVIEESIEELHQISQYRITPDYKKEGRKIVSIAFNIRLEKQIEAPKELDKGSLDQESLELLKRICSFGIGEKTARDYLASYELDYIVGNLNVVEQKLRMGEIKRSAAGYLAAALQEDFRTSKSIVELDLDEEKERRALEKAEGVAKVEAAKREEAEKARHRINEAKARFESLPNEEQDSLIDEFYSYIEQHNSFIYNTAKKTGLGGVAVAAVFYAWLADKFGV